MMDRYQLRYFLAVVDQGNFSRAAAQCNVSQPTLSVGVAKLERDLGAKLFARSSQRVQLTAAGTKFLAHARRIESEFHQAAQAMSGASSQDVVRIGVLRSIPGKLIAAAMARMRAADPLARVELVEGSEREITNHVARGRVDCALTLVGRGGHRFLEETIFEEGYALALPKDHRHAELATIKAEMLAEDVMIVRRHCEALSETSRHFLERGIRPHFAMRSTNDERVLQQIASGLGITIMPDSYSFPGVLRPGLAGFDLRRSVGLVYGAGSETLAATPPACIDAIRKGLRAVPGSKPIRHAA